MAVDMSRIKRTVFNAPPAGHSLTNDVTQWPWGKPAREVDPERAMSKIMDSLDEPRIRQFLIKLLLANISVQVITRMMMLDLFQRGAFTQDMLVMMRPSIALYIAGIAERAQIPYRFFENESEVKTERIDDETFLTMIADRNPELFEQFKESYNQQLRMGKVRKVAEEEIQEKSFIASEKDED